MSKHEVKMSIWRKLCLLALLAIFLQMCEAQYNQGEELKAFTCEGSTLSISCLHKGLIRIVRANYGRFTITQCNFYAQTEGWDMQCHSPNSDIVVRQRCDGRVTCNIAAENDVFGADPCPSTYKYLDVHYICEKDRTQTVPKSQVAKVGDVVELICSKDDMEDSSVTLEMLATTKWTKIEGNISSNAREEGTKLIIPDVTAKDAGTYCCTVTFGSKSFQSKISLNISSPYPPHVSKVQTTPRMTTTTVSTTRQPTTPRSTPRRRPSPSTTPITTTTTVSTTTSTTTTTTRAPRTTPRRITKKKPISTTPRIPINIPKRSTTPNPIPTTRRIRKKCQDQVVDGIWWPPVNAGVISERPCPEDKIGIAKWECGQDDWIGNVPNYTDCVAPWLQDIANTVNYTKPQNSMSELSRSMKISKLGSGDIIKTTKEIIPELTKILQNEVEKPGGKPNSRPKIDAVTNFTEGFISVGSAMLQPNQQDGWNEMPPEERSRVATTLTKTMESTAYEIASLLNMTSQIEIATDNIKLEIAVAEVGNTNDMRLPSTPYTHSSREPSNFITIPKENLVANSKNGMVRVVCMLYNNLGELLKEITKEQDEPEKKSNYDNSEIHHGKFSKTPQLSVQQEENANEILAAEIPENTEAVQKVNTKILSVSMTHTHNYLPLEKPVVFVLKHNQEELTKNPQCVYWDYTSSMDGHWSTEGCTLLSTNNTHTTCECNHLTSFAVLMDFIGTKLPSHHEHALYIITMVGCIISIISLFCCFFTFCYFRNLQCERNTIHKNLVLSLMLAEIVFLAGIHQTEYKILCSVVAGVLHYLFLVAFAWMCLEGILLYIMLIEVFEAESRRTVFYLFGYGIPAIIVAVSLGLDYTGYGTERYCWLRTDNYFILSFVIPVGLIIVINISMLLLAIYMMHTHANPANSKERSTKEKIKGWIKGAVVLIVLLGLTWGFGLFYVNKQSVVMAYIFTVCNSLQGLFIFIFHCIMNEKVCKEYKKAIKNSSWIPACIKSICSGGAGDRSSTPNPSTSSGNFISKLWSRKRKTSSTSNSIKTSTRVKSPVSVETCGDSDYQTSKQIMSDYDYPTHLAPRGKQSLYQKDVQSGADELSTFDCSVIDSEFVSEYCQTNLQVNQEQNRLSPVSSNESLTPSYADSIEKNRLSLLSRDSDLQQNNSFSSDKVPVLDEDLMKLAVKEKLYDYETEPLMYTNMNTSEVEQNMINNLLNDGDSGISNGPQLMANHHTYSMPCCQPLPMMGEDCSPQILMQRGMTSLPGYPIYHDYSHSNPYSSVDVGLANGGSSRNPAERMQHRADDRKHLQGAVSFVLAISCDK